MTDPSPPAAADTSADTTADTTADATVGSTPASTPPDAPTGPARDEDGRPVLDALGMPCPRPVLELAAAVRELAVGDEVVLLADDPAADVDVPVWCRMQRQLLVAQDQDGRTLRFVVRKLREI